MELIAAPLALLLAKDGSRGDKLLFKYPYCYERLVPLVVNELPQLGPKSMYIATVILASTHSFA